MSKERKNDGVVEAICEAVLGYANKGASTDEAWVDSALSKDAGACQTEEERRQDAREILAMTEAFDREHEAFDAARAEGRSSANYLMAKMDEAAAECGSDAPSKTAQEMYASVMQGGAHLLGELGFAPETEGVSTTLPTWNDENKGDMVKEMVGALSAQGVMALGDVSESVVSTADQTGAEGGDGDATITDYVERQSREKSCKGLAVPMSAAIVKCARKGMLGEKLKKVPADAITTATCVASEGVKTLVRVGNGEMTLDEGREKMAEAVCVAAGAYVGKKAGEKVGRGIGRLVGSVFGPVGAEVCGKVCSKVGAFVGHKVGKAVGKAVYKVGKVYRKAKSWLKEKVGGAMRSVGRAVGRFFSCLKFW